MIDGITIKYKIKNFDAWRRTVNLSFDNYVDTLDTGDVRSRKIDEKITITYRSKWGSFNLIVKDTLNIKTGKQSFYFTIRGSLHKNHYRGSNYIPFTFQDLQEQINHLTKSLCINPIEAQISTLEVGLNVCTPFEVTPFLNRNVISYKGNSFNRYTPDRDGVCLGIVCQLSQYAVKIYDKGLQYDLPENLMRFELRYLKMQSLNKMGIKFLSDLQDFTKVYSLQAILFQAWNDVLIYDVQGNVKKLSLKQHEIDSLIEGNNPKFWERLKETNAGDRFKNSRTKFKNLVAIHGNNWQTIVNDLLKNEWQNLFKNYPNLPTVKNHLLPDLTIKVNGKNGQKGFTLKKRYCISCNKELNPAQKNNSKYCSAKFVGKAAAHKCRNNNSNHRNNLKKKIKLITSRGLLFDIIPFINKQKLTLPLSKAN